MLQNLIDEFKVLTNNQAYEHAFIKRFLRQDPNNTELCIGNTQRQDFLKHLRPLLSELPEPAQIFDFGAGDGEIIDQALHIVPRATINLEEPSSLLLDQYKERVHKSPNLTLGVCYNGPVQGYYQQNGQPSPPHPQKQQDLILAVHMIYHLTDFTHAQIDPDDDIKHAFGAMYSLLKPGGILFIVFAHHLTSLAGLANLYYFQKKGATKIVANLQEIRDSRYKLLKEGLLENYLNATFPDSKANIVSTITNSYLYGDKFEDIVAMCLIAELGLANDEPFDVEKLHILSSFVDEYKEEIGLTVENRDVPQKGMLRANQPQIITVIRRQSI